MSELLPCYYGLTKPEQAVEIVAAVCSVLGFGSAGAAPDLLIETAAQETHLGLYRDPTPNGAGRGLFQIDLIAFDDVRNRANASDVAAIDRAFGIDIRKALHVQLDTSPLLSAIFCRLFYKLIPHPIPSTLDGRADYWKHFYNTASGAGTVAEYIKNAQKYGVY